MFLIVKGPNGGFNLRFCTSPRTHHLNWSFHPQRYSWWCHLTSKTAPVSPFNPRVQVQLLQFIVGRWQQPRLTAHHGWNLCLKALWQHTYHQKYVRITFRQKKKKDNKGDTPHCLPKLGAFSMKHCTTDACSLRRLSVLAFIFSVPSPEWRRFGANITDRLLLSILFSTLLGFIKIKKGEVNGEMLVNKLVNNRDVW